MKIKKVKKRTAQFVIVLSEKELRKFYEHVCRDFEWDSTGFESYWSGLAGDIREALDEQ